MIPLGVIFSKPLTIALFVVMMLFLFGLIVIAVSGRKDKDSTETVNLKALVIVPCRGMDYSLEDNLRHLLEQDYRNFKIIAVVDSSDDPAVKYLKGTGMDYIISDFDCRHCSGKVKAISSAIKSFKDFDVYVIADSDITVEKTWLSRLLSPFSRDDVGISTTFPYFLPVGGFWSKVKLVWGFVGLGMMESKLTRFGWGGSLAFRKSIVSGENFKFFSEFVSDDIALTKLCKKEGKSIAYVAGSRPIINSPDNFRTFIEWSNRQTSLSVYATRNVLYYGILIYSATLAIFVLSILLSVLLNPIFLIFLIPTVINAAKAMKRSGRNYLITFLVSIFLPFLYMYNLLHALKAKSISWRGREYSLYK
ncbi:MAG: glycosyltransferase family 2 protein [Thermoplasmatales archaeon]|nr:glycosyltransferase family 2 protein [Thermoplasmatales archaeon]MCW6170031.1 glycosyltransferase family 2 protein [Thermoplasmatales archaeon]